MSCRASSSLCLCVPAFLHPHFLYPSIPNLYIPPSLCLCITVSPSLHHSKRLSLVPSIPLSMCSRVSSSVYPCLPVSFHPSTSPSRTPRPGMPVPWCTGAGRDRLHSSLLPSPGQRWESPRGDQALLRRLSFVRPLEERTHSHRRVKSSSWTVVKPTGTLSSVPRW